MDFHLIYAAVFTLLSNLLLIPRRHKPRSTDTFSAFTSINLKPHLTLLPVFRKPKNVVSVSDKSGLVYKIPCRDCDAVYIGETGRSLKTSKPEHMEAVKEMDLKKSPHYANMS